LTLLAVTALLFACVLAAAAQNLPEPLRAPGKKVFMITDMEGVDGIFDRDLQVEPFKSPRWEESRKLLTGDINAAVDGLLAGGATQVVVWDGHDSSHTLSALDIHPKAILLAGEPIAPTLELDPSYSAVIFIGQHAMAGASGGILHHSYSSASIQNIWVNNQPVGEIGGRVMLAGSYGIPVIMLSGDHAACHEFLAMVNNAECAEVKWGVSWSAGYTLSHPAAVSLIREKTERAMRRLAEIKPYRMNGPVEVKVEFATQAAAQNIRPREGVERLNERTWAFRGKDIRDAWLKFSDF
jgi:D-amino peptidase